MQALAQGGNNRTWLVTTSASGKYAAKQYFRHDDDTRNRLAAETNFMHYAAQCAPGCAPQVLAVDQAAGLALFDFLPGHGLRAGEVGLPETQAAAAFFCALNGDDRLARAANLGVASEACFSIQGHLDLIGGRIAKLREALQSPGRPEDTEARRFIERVFLRWQVLTNEIQTRALRHGLDLQEELAREQRCISPSDFGFHNALASEGTIRFLDFEYAGWDDPAKMVGDFFAQLAVPVPPEHFQFFTQACLAPFDDRDALLRRATLLRPAYQIKWCCIAMNIFLPVHLARRKFANPALDEQTLKHAQLAKAATLFHSLGTIDHGLH